MLILVGKPCELEGLSSKAPRTVGLSREIGRRPGDSIDFERLRDPFDRLEEAICSPVAALRLLLLKVRHMVGRESESVLLLFCRNSVSANLLRKEDALEVKDPVAEGFERFPEIEPYAELPPPPKAMAPGPISSNKRSDSSTMRSNKLM